MRVITAWEIHLAGPSEMLEEMARVYSGPDPVVYRREQDYFLSSPRFLAITDSLEVINAAAVLVRRLAGLLNLYGNLVGDVRPDGAEWTDSNGRRGGAGRIARLHSNMVSRDQIAFLASQTDEGESRGSRLQRVAEANPLLLAVLDVTGPEPLGFGGLYMLYELLRADAGGLDHLAAHARVPKAKLKLFAQTANTFRHARPLAAKPVVPMPFHEALPFIRGIARDWLNKRL